jgi:hypothetical protein
MLLWAIDYAITLTNPTITTALRTYSITILIYITLWFEFAGMGIYVTNFGWVDNLTVLISIAGSIIQFALPLICAVLPTLAGRITGDCSTDTFIALSTKICLYTVTVQKTLHAYRIFESCVTEFSVWFGFWWAVFICHTPLYTYTILVADIPHITI